MEAQRISVSHVYPRTENEQDFSVLFSDTISQRDREPSWSSEFTRETQLIGERPASVADLPGERFPYSKPLLGELYLRWASCYWRTGLGKQGNESWQFERAMFKRYRLWYEISLAKFVYYGSQPRKIGGQPLSLEERIQSTPFNISRLILYPIRPFQKRYLSVEDISNAYPYTQDTLDELAYRWHISYFTSRDTEDASYLESFEARMFQKFRLEFDRVNCVLRHFGPSTVVAGW